MADEALHGGGRPACAVSAGCRRALLCGVSPPLSEGVNCSSPGPFLWRDFPVCDGQLCVLLPRWAVNTDTLGHSGVHNSKGLVYSKCSLIVERARG